MSARTRRRPWFRVRTAPARPLFVEGGVMHMLFEGTNYVVFGPLGLAEYYVCPAPLWRIP